MTKDELNEANGLAQQVISALKATAAASVTAASAQLIWMCGQLSVSVQQELIPQPGDGASPFWADLILVFEHARTAGATFPEMDKVRSLAEAFTPKSPTAIAVANFSVRMALAEEAQILAATTFTTREQIDRLIDQVTASFCAAEDVAADSMDNVAYRALISLHAAVTNDLSQRALPLPQIVTFSFPARVPALTLAQRIYQDPSQTLGLIQMSGAVHPAFMPQTVHGLSN